MRVGVTGADGFTGRYVLAALARDHEPVSLSADLTLAGAIEAEVAAVRPDAVIHLAARAFVDSADHAAFYAVNQIGTFRLLDALAMHAPGIGVLLASSAQVYGAQAAGLVGEDALLNPGNHYALSKAAMELGSRFWSDRLRVTIARPFNYTGAGQELRYLVPKLVDAFRRRQPSVTLGRIDVERDFGDVRAVADAYRGLTEQAPGGIINIGTGVVTSIGTLIGTLTAITGHRIEINVDQALVRTFDVPVLGCDIRLLQQTLPGWKPRPLEETLRWMLAGR